MPGVNPFPHLSITDCEGIADKNLQMAQDAVENGTDEATVAVVQMHASLAQAAATLAAYKRNMAHGVSKPPRVSSSRKAPGPWL